MAATLHALAILLVLSAISSALLFQPVFRIFAYTMSATASDISFPTQTKRLTARTNPSTQPSMASSATAANTTTSPQDQSSSNSGVISTVVFGCIASILGVLAIWATMWLGRRQISLAARNNTSARQAPEPDLLLEGIQIGVPHSHDTTTNSTSVPKPPEPTHHPWGIVPQDTHAPACATSVIDSPPPAYVPSNVRV